MTAVAEREEGAAAAITRKSRSNLAFALACLPREKRDDMVTFYAFCRVVDDIADDPSREVEDRRSGLDHWRQGLGTGVFEGAAGLEGEVAALLLKHGISREMPLEIIRGVEMDLDRRRYDTFEELKEYCYRVACVVGLVSAEIFGYTNAATRAYAENLGYALQITNIMRDVGEDWESEERIYLPREDMEEYGYTEEDLKGGVHDERFVQLMQKEAGRARSYYEQAERGLPAEDRRPMLAAEIMRAIYSRILGKMRGDSFRVFEKRYRLSRVRMLGLFAGVYLRNRLT